MKKGNDNSGDNGLNSPQDKAVKDPDQWKTGSEELTEAQKVHQNVQNETNKADMQNEKGEGTKEGQ